MIARINSARNFRVLLVGVLLAITPGPTQAQQSATWKSVSDPGSNFTVEMPDVPEHSEQLLKTPAGTAYTLHTYSVGPDKNTAYVIQTAEYPTDVDVSVPKNNLQWALDGGATNLKDGKWANITWGEHEGLPAVAALGMRGELEVRCYVVMKGSRLFILLYGGPEGTGKTPSVDRFMNSLQISK
jgi:hypothetical protein